MAMTVQSMSILSWNAGFAKERAGSAMIKIAPVTSNIGIASQMIEAYRPMTPAIDCSLPARRSNLRSIIKTAIRVAAIARM